MVINLVLASSEFGRDSGNKGKTGFKNNAGIGILFLADNIILFFLFNNFNAGQKFLEDWYFYFSKAT